GKLKLFHLEDGGFNHQRDYKMITVAIIYYSGYGHTAKVAEEINKSVEETGANVSIIQIWRINHVHLSDESLFYSD
ncbi:MAG: flavodoxin family protein, partial [Rickettsia endosymbiont of Ixodes persulcatus]|nr:flavodoxin family protein [Rickettsia endosymbiont of Ixodes persulcatus]